MAQVIPLRPHTFRLDNGLIDDYAAEMGAIGVAIYAVLQRYADRTTGQCWPSVSTMARLLRLSKNCVKKYLHHLARLGLITIAPRSTAEGDPTSNLYTVHDPTQRDAVLRRQRARGGPPAAGGEAPAALPPQGNGHLVPQGGAPAGPEQDLQEQETLTSVPTPKMAAQPCQNQAHEHRSPVPGLRICLDCFRSWEVPLTVLPPAGDPAGSAGPRQPTAGRR
jgi:Helix-turn-helix domain